MDINYMYTNTDQCLKVLNEQSTAENMVLNRNNLLESRSICFTDKDSKDDIFGLYNTYNEQHGLNNNTYSKGNDQFRNFPYEPKTETPSTICYAPIQKTKGNQLNSFDANENSKNPAYKTSDVININSDDDYCEIVGEVNVTTTSINSIKIEPNNSQNKSHINREICDNRIHTPTVNNCENKFDSKEFHVSELTLDNNSGIKNTYKDKDYSVPLFVDTSLQYTMNEDVDRSNVGHVGLLMIVSTKMCSSDNQKSVCNKDVSEERYDPYLPSCAPDTDSDSNDTWPGSYNQNNYQSGYQQVPTQHEATQGYMGIGAWQYNSQYNDYRGMCSGNEYYNFDLKSTCYTSTSFMHMNHVSNQGLHQHQLFYNSSPMQANSVYYSSSPFSAYVVNTNFSKGASNFMPHTHFGSNIYAEEWLMNQ